MPDPRGGVLEDISAIYWTLWPLKTLCDKKHTWKYKLFFFFDFFVCDSNLQKHIPDNSDENPVENLDSWYETEAKAKATQTTNVGQEFKPGHPLGFLVLWWDRITYF